MMRTQITLRAADLDRELLHQPQHSFRPKKAAHTHTHLQPKQLEVALDYARVGDVRVGVAIRADAHSDGAHRTSNAVNDGHLQRVVDVKPAL